MVDWEGFVSSVKNDGRASSYLFEWFSPPKFLGSFVSNLIYGADYFLKSTTLPESTVEELSTYWMGQQYKCGGARRYGDWTITVQCQESIINLRLLFEIWMNFINHVPLTSSINNLEGMDYVLSLLGPLTSMTYGEPNNENLIESLLSLDFNKVGYFSDQVLGIIDSKNKPIIVVYLVDSWPKSIGPINLDHSSSDFVQFDVTFGYSHHYIL